MHNWGDETVDWEGISNAASFIALNLKKWGRVPVRDWKEKFGTVRIYCSMGWSSIHDITHPGYVYTQYPRGGILFYLNYARWMWRVMWLLNLAVVPFHCWLYRRLYRLAVQRWPHLRQEILCAADYHELLKGL